MSSDFEVMNESIRCWEKKFLLCNNSNYGVDLQSSILYIISVSFFNRDNLLPVTVVGLLLHLLVTYGVTNKPFIIVSQGKPFKNYVIVHVCIHAVTRGNPLL